MATTLKEWFCLQDGRQNFKPNVRADRELIFCHTEQIEEKAQMSIERSFATGEPVKMMIYGNWGVGKTHAVHHICWWLEQNPEYTAETVFVEVGDINKKSRFDVLIRPFLEEVGINTIVDLVNNYLMSSGGKNIRDGLKAIGIGTEVVEDYASFMMTAPGSTPVPATEQAFEHLKGGATKGGSSGKLEQSRDFYDVLASLGHLFKVVEGKNLILIADEAARLDEVESDDATRSHWDAVNRMIFDDSNIYFGFIYTLGASSERDIPRVLAHPQTESRIGKRNLIKLENLSEIQTKDFLNNLLRQFVDLDEVNKLVGAGTIGAEFKAETYPFTEPAYERFVDHWGRDPENAKPRDICDNLTDAAFIAMKKGKRLIDDATLEAIGM
tara:strand:- start:719 stop:1867 length:1149 start_codon:yes stop_codon:yes gene_type:complete